MGYDFLGIFFAFWGLFRIFGYINLLTNLNFKGMKSVKIRDGRVTVDGVIYSPKWYEDVKIMGKEGRILNLKINGIQYFPMGGVFDDGTIKVVDSSTEVMDELPTPPIKRKRSSKKASE